MDTNRIEERLDLLKKSNEKKELSFIHITSINMSSDPSDKNGGRYLDFTETDIKLVDMPDLLFAYFSIRDTANRIKRFLKAHGPDPDSIENKLEVIRGEIIKLTRREGKDVL